LLAQVATRKHEATTKEIMKGMTIPASDALFNVPEKPTAEEWADFRKKAGVLLESADLLLAPGQVKSKTANPRDWDAAAKALREAAQMAVKAIDKKDPEQLSGDVGEKLLASCTACHTKYMPKQ
jgi:hypothetical protein